MNWFVEIRDVRMRSSPSRVIANDFLKPSIRKHPFEGKQFSFNRSCSVCEPPKTRRSQILSDGRKRIKHPHKLSDFTKLPGQAIFIVLLQLRDDGGIVLLLSPNLIR